MTNASFDSKNTPLQDRFTWADDGTAITRKPKLFRPGVELECYDEALEEWDTEQPLRGRRHRERGEDL